MALTTWTVDRVHTDIQFSARHMMVTNVRGKFPGVDGVLLLDLDQPTNSSGNITVRAASLTTGFDRRDDHLRSADFLDVEAHPAITFVSTAVQASGGNRYRVTGNLTIRGVTRTITLGVEHLGLYAGLDGSRLAGFRASATLDREDWDLTWNVALESGGWLVGREIRLEMDIEARQEAPAANADVAAAA